MTELLSVVLPTHNRPEKLRTAAHSVLGQGYPSIELVIVDDGSTDTTARTLEELAAQDRRVVVVRLEESLGSAAARNAGLAVAGGELVAFCDDDDIWVQGSASAAVAASTPSTGVVYGWHQVLHEATGRLVTFRTAAECTPTVMRWINVPWILSGVSAALCAGRCPLLRPGPTHLRRLGPLAQVRRHRTHDAGCDTSVPVRPARRGTAPPEVRPVRWKAASASSTNIDPACRPPASLTTN